MGRTLVLLWLGAASAQSQKAPDIGSWAESRHVVVVPPTVARHQSVRYRPDIAIDVEGHLLEARTALEARDAAAALAALDSARRALREHPLPQAAWLMAEIYRLDAERLRSEDPERAESLMDAAELLGQARAPSFRDGPAGLLREGPKPRRIPLTGLHAGDELYVDGLRSSEIPSAGEHHVLLVRQGRSVFSGWVTPDGEQATVPMIAAPPCTDRDLEGTRLVTGRLEVPKSVICPKWAVAHPTTEGIAVAICERNVCGTLLPWRRGQGETLAAPAQPYPQKTGFPAWLGWTLAGVATATATSFVLWQTGAFDAPEPGTTRFVFTAPERPAAR